MARGNGTGSYYLNYWSRIRWTLPAKSRAFSDELGVSETLQARWHAPSIDMAGKCKTYKVEKALHLLS